MGMGEKPVSLLRPLNCEAFILVIVIFRLNHSGQIIGDSCDSHVSVLFKFIKFSKLNHLSYFSLMTCINNNKH